MSIASEPTRCPQCGGAIPPEAPQGLCPKCLLLQASISTEAGQPSAAKPTLPTREQLAAAFPQLEILELIGRGGMGFVFKARQPRLDRFVALKILPQSLAADPAFAERFTREGRVLARLNHPNIVTIHDFGVVTGAPTDTRQFFYLLMEFVDGVNLRQAMNVGRFTPEQALAIVPKICEALQFAHNEGILHRDIKPENILLDSKGRVKIADFGIAKLVGSDAGTSLGVPPSSGADRLKPELQTTALTETGKVLGTPHYMAPEQIEKPGEVDHRADIYSLGVVFYEMLTGELPIGRFVPPSEKSGADPRVNEVVLRALERERERRPQSADELRTQVETIAATPQSGGGGREAAETTSPGEPAGETQPAPDATSTSRRPASLIIVASLFVLLGCYGAWQIGRSLHQTPNINTNIATVRQVIGPPFAGRLPQGAIELVAVGTGSSSYPATNQSYTWWRPDGDPTGEYSYERSPGRIGFGFRQSLHRQLLFKVAGLPPDASELRIAECDSALAYGCEPAWQKGRPVPEWKLGCLELLTTAKTLRIKVGLATGLWDQSMAMSVPGPEGHSRVGYSREGIDWNFSVQSIEESNGSTRIVAYHTENKDWESKFVLVDFDGKEWLPQNGASDSSGGLNHLSGTCNLKISQIKEIRLHIRPYQWVEFRDVSLQSGRKTTVEIQDPESEKEAYLESQKISFGPVHAQELHLNAQGFSECLDLDSGKITSPPTMQTATDWAKVELPPGIMIIPRTAEHPTMICVTGMSLVDFSTPSNEYWDGRTGLANALLASEAVVNRRQKFMLERELPRLFRYKTDSGKAGLLQITEIIENPRSARVRYRLLEAVKK